MLATPYEHIHLLAVGGEVKSKISAIAPGAICLFQALEQP